MAYRELRAARAAGALALDRPGAPRRWLRDGEVGLKLSAVLAGWDLALMAYRGYFDEPLFRLGFSPYGLPTARGEYARYRAYGFSWAKGFGPGTFRGEAVLKPDFPAQGPLGWGRSSLFQAVVGWDRDFEGFFYLNGQFFFESYAKTPYSPKDDREGLTYEASFKWGSDEWAAGARGQIYLTGEGAVNAAFLVWRYNDNLKFSVGALIFSGAKVGFLGQWGYNDCLYLTGRYSF
jgi:hypothetical protein